MGRETGQVIADGRRIDRRRARSTYDRGLRFQGLDLGRKLNGAEQLGPLADEASSQHTSVWTRANPGS